MTRFRTSRRNCPQARNKRKGLHRMPAKPITRFRLAYDFLSNFYPVLITLDGLDYLSAEAAYQAYKCENREERRAFARISADEAKRLGRKIAIRPDWDAVKLDVMRRWFGPSLNSTKPRLFSARDGRCPVARGEFLARRLLGRGFAHGRGRKSFGQDSDGFAPGVP